MTEYRPTFKKSERKRRLKPAAYVLMAVVVFALLVAAGFAIKTIRYRNARPEALAAVKLDITPTPTPTRQPQPAVSTTPQPASTPVPVAVVKADVLNVREGPGTDYEVVGKVHRGEELEVLEEGEGWIKVRFEGEEAWVSADYVEVARNPADSQTRKPVPRQPWAKELVKVEDPIMGKDYLMPKDEKELSHLIPGPGPLFLPSHPRTPQGQYRY